MNALRSGIWAGILATGPMTLALFSLQKRMPERQKSPLPPATLTNQITGSRSPDLTMISHFGYGIGTALIYSLLTRKESQRPLMRGTLFGLGVWGASYFGWIPFFGFRARGTNLLLKRNAMMIFAHAVWGLALGSAHAHLREEGNQMLRGNRRAPNAE